MSDIENKELLRILKEYKEKFSKDKKAAKDFFVEIGIINQKGDLTKNYKNLCIPQGQA